ncbi:MAG: FAD-dependent oxidoreductase [Proteobacteria bacterium]|nr:FAD-dependent oxidoreductase [Pseudomonadota bacterium]
MKPFTRRKFGKLAGAAATTIIGRGLWPGPALGRTTGKPKPKAVIIGGGASGATAARRLAEDFQGIDVTLIEANRQYTACFFASRYLGGIRTLADITHGYGNLAANHAVTVINAAATAIDGDKKAVILGNRTRIEYDRLIVAPGIDMKFDLIDGYDEKTTDLFPHAYKADTQISILKRQLEAMDDGGVFAISSPSRPYRCPPAPYERAAMAAFYLKKHKPRSKIQILDSKNEFPMSEVMNEVWGKLYPGMIEWIPAEFGGKIKAVDVKGKTLISSEERFTADVLNIIPDQHAGRIAQVSGLAGKNGWCPIHASTFESRLVPGIHVVGDAIDPGDMSKSAFSANSQARACAAAVGAALTGSKAVESPLTNTCFFMVAEDHGLKLGGTYKATPAGLTGLTGYLSQVGENVGTRKQTARDGDAWYAAVTKEMFS